MSDTAEYLDHAAACSDAAAALQSNVEKAVLLRIAREWQSEAIESAPPAAAPTVWTGSAIVAGSELPR
jgi:hypothetical protein